MKRLFEFLILFVVGIHAFGAGVDYGRYELRNDAVNRDVRVRIDVDGDAGDIATLNTSDAETITLDGSSGIVQVGAGSAAAPSLSFVGDPDTGFYNAPNLIGFSAGGTARAYLNTTGFGIGIVPTFPFHVSSSNTAGSAYIANTSGALAGYPLQVVTVTATSNFEGAQFIGFKPGLAFKDNSASAHDFRIGVDANALKVSIDTDDDDGRDANGHLSDTPNALVVTSTGVGIGTSAPAVPFHIQKATLAELRIDATGGVSNDTARINFYSNGGRSLGRIESAVNSGFVGDLRFFTNPTGSLGAETEKMRILGSGNVGIGTSAPVPKVSIKDAGASFINIGQISGNSAYAGISVGATSAQVSASNYIILGDAASTYLGRPTGGDIFFRENNVTQAVLKTGGNFGIGETAPDSPLQVRALTGSNQYLFKMTNYQDEDVFSGYDSGTYGGTFYIKNASNATKVILAADGGSYFNGGNFGINVSTADDKLELQGNLRMYSGVFQVAATETAPTTYNRLGTGVTGHGLNAANQLLVTGAAEFDAQVYADDDIYFPDNKGLQLGSSQYGVVRWNSSTLALDIISDDDLLLDADGDVTIPTGATLVLGRAAPASSAEAATTGSIAVDDSYIYVRRGSAWKRVALSTF